MTIDYGMVIVALGNVGAVGVVGKFLLKGVERSNESLPVILEAIATHSKAIEELFKARNILDGDVREIKVLHKYKRCDQIDDMKVKRKET